VSEFKEQLEKKFEDFFKVVSTEKNYWTVKGFIDIYKNIYTISTDTKVVSKIIELMIFPILVKFADENDYTLILAEHQNHYPDLSFIDNKTNEKYALDIKSSYRTSRYTINGMTLGAFTGYFRNRTSNKNITFPYSEYSNHYILGIIYSKSDIENCQVALKKNKITLTQASRKKLEKYLTFQTDENFDDFTSTIEAKMKKNSLSKKVVEKIIAPNLIDEKTTFQLKDIRKILSVVKEFDFFVQEKWKIAIDRPGSGNTKNIGSTRKISELKNGTGLFTKEKEGSKVFNQYWKNYMTKDMARAIDLEVPHYSNLKSYKKYISELK
jgi:hypothetical protein